MTDEQRIDKPNEHIEFRYYGEELDEIVARNVNVHFECMGTGSWWMRLRTPDGQDFDVNLGVKRVKSAGENRDCVWFDKHLANWAHHEEDA